MSRRIFNPKTPHARHESRYSSPDNIATEHQVSQLAKALVIALQPDYCIEVGSYLGHTSKAIGEGLKENGHGVLDAIEANANNADATRRACDGLPVEVHTTSFEAWSPPEGRERVGFAWVDATSRHRARDARRVMGWAHAGAIIAVHDTNVRFQTAESLLSIARDDLARIIFLPTLRGVGLLEVLA